MGRARSAKIAILLLALLATTTLLTSSLPSLITVVGETGRAKGYGLQATPGVRALGRPRADKLMHEERGLTLAPPPPVPDDEWPDERHPLWPELDNSSLHEFATESKPRPLSPGPDDWVVTGEEVHEDETIILTGNLIVQSGGNLTLINCTLYMNCSCDGEWQIIVNSSGVMNVLEGSVITAYNSWYEFLFYVYGQLVMRDSELHECGYCYDHPGLWLETDEGVVIENCTISNCYDGIYCEYSSDINITNCEISQNYNYRDGIDCHDSSDITIRNNVFSYDGVVLYGYKLRHFASHTIEDNIVNGKPLYYIVNITGPYTVPSNAGQVIIVNSTHITLTGMNLSYTDVGLEIAYAEDVHVENSIINQNDLDGIYCCYSSDITIMDCEISQKYRDGIYCGDSSDVDVHYCNIFSNDEHGLYVKGTYIVNATYNWWGNPDGPEYKAEGDPCDPEEIYSENGSGYVLYEQWLSPAVYVSPPYGTRDTVITIKGEGFTGNSQVDIYFNTSLIATVETDDEGCFTVSDIFMIGQAGRYVIKAVDERGLWAEAFFDLYDFSPLQVSVDVGSIHFRGEIAEFYVLTAHHGRPVNITSFNATLYWPNGTTQAMAYEQIATGLYKVVFNTPVDAPTGTYTLFVMARLNTSHIDAWGSAIRSFLLSPTLTEWNARLIAIENDTAIIKTDVGVIKMNLTEIKAEIEGIQGDLIVVKSDVGTILAKLDTLNATLVEIRDDVLEIQTALGELEAKLEAVNATIIDVLSDEMGDYYVLLNTTLGELEAKLDMMKEWLSQMNATIVAIQGDIAILKTNTTTILAKLDALNATLTMLIQDAKGEVIAQIQTVLGNLTAKLDALNATIMALRGDVAVVITTLGQIEAKLDALNTTITLVEANIVEIKTLLDTIRGNITDINGHLATIETDIGWIKARIAEWTGATTSISGYKVMALTTSELRALWAEGTLIKISLHAPSDGLIHVFVPKDLLASLGVSLNSVDVVLDWLETSYRAVDLGSCYVLLLRYGPGDHAVEIYLTGAPIYKTVHGLAIISGGAVVAVGVAAWLIHKRRKEAIYEALTRRLLGKSS